MVVTFVYQIQLACFLRFIAAMEDLTKLCRLCMTAPKTGEMTSIFEDQEKSFSMKIITCFSVEVISSLCFLSGRD